MLVNLSEPAFINLVQVNIGRQYYLFSLLIILYCFIFTFLTHFLQNKKSNKSYIFIHIMYNFVVFKCDIIKML